MVWGGLGGLEVVLARVWGGWGCFGLVWGLVSTWGRFDFYRKSIEINFRQWKFDKSVSTFNLIQK